MPKNTPTHPDTPWWRSDEATECTSWTIFRAGRAMGAHHATAQETLQHDREHCCRKLAVLFGGESRGSVQGQMTHRDSKNRKGATYLAGSMVTLGMRAELGPMDTRNEGQVFLSAVTGPSTCLYHHARVDARIRRIMDHSTGWRARSWGHKPR